MERVTLRIPKAQIDEIEDLVETGEFPSKSEAIRQAVREMIDDKQPEYTPQKPWAKV